MLIFVERIVTVGIDRYKPRETSLGGGAWGAGFCGVSNWAMAFPPPLLGIQLMISVKEMISSMAVRGGQEPDTEFEMDGRVLCFLGGLPRGWETK